MPSLFGGGVDVATLGLRVDAREVENATASLGRLQREGERVEQTTGRVAITTGHMNRGMAATAHALEDVATRTGGLNRRLVRTISMFSSFAVSGAATVAIVGGLALVSVWWRRLTADARAYEEAQRDALAGVVDAAQRLRGGDPGLDADLRIGMEGVRARERERQELLAQRDQLLGGRQARRMDEIQRQARQLEEIDRRLGELRNLDLLFGTSAADIAFARALEAQPEADRRARRAVAGFVAPEIGTVFGDLTLGDPRSGAPTEAQLHRARQATFASEAFQALAEEQQELVREMIEREEELALVRQRANDALILSLENVGRAYGGVIDQIFALTAATLRLFNEPRLPGFGGPGSGTGEGGAVTLGDQLRGYGTAALSGIGYGLSTGSPIAGALGGGLGGFAAAGPAGAIVGAVGGIVSGLFEHGRRAEEAARIWEANFTAFDRLFDDPGTELEQRLRLIDEQFLALVQSLDYTVLGTDGYTKALQRLEKARAENIKQAHDMEDAERDLHDARFQAMNAPSLLNLELLAYQTTHGPGRGRRRSNFDYSAIGVPDGGDGSVSIAGDVNINVDGSAAPEATAQAVYAEIKRLARRGGPSPYSPAAR